MKDFRYMAIVAAAALGLAVAGCGSSGSDDGPSAETPSGPTQAEQIATLQGQINALRAQLGLAANDNLSNSISDLQNELAKLRKDVADDAAKKMTAKLNKLATGIGAVDSRSLAAHVQTATAKPGTATDGDAPHAIDGWNGSSYSMTLADRSTTMTVVYNDKAADTPGTFNKRFTIIDDDTNAQNGKVLLVEASHAKLIGIGGLPTHASHAGVEVGPVNGVRGTLAGAAGTFTSDTGTISVGISATDGSPTWTGNLHFKPDSTTATVMMPDTTYMNLGWWLNEMENGDLDPTVAAWATGTAYAEGNKMAALIGKAKFNGIAVGKYTHKTINSIYGGHFNADAELVADFGDTTAQGTLTGTIDNFMQDGTPIASGWKVELGAAAAGDPLAFDPKAGATITSGAVEDTNNGALGTFGNQKTMGTWNATFVDNTRNDNMPGGVVGTFHVGEESHPVNMVGAFAASNSEKDQPKN